MAIDFAICVTDLCPGTAKRVRIGGGVVHAFNDRPPPISSVESEDSASTSHEHTQSKELADERLRRYHIESASPLTGPINCRTHENKRDSLPRRFSNKFKAKLLPINLLEGDLFFAGLNELTKFLICHIRNRNKRRS